MSRLLLNEQSVPKSVSVAGEILGRYNQITYICEQVRSAPMANKNTTLNLPASLIARTKAYAAAEGTTMTAIVRSHLEADHGRAGTADGECSASLCRRVDQA